MGTVMSIYPTPCSAPTHTFHIDIKVLSPCDMDSSTGTVLASAIVVATPGKRPPRGVALFL